jgi:hypothetical protein
VFTVDAPSERAPDAADAPDHEGTSSSSDDGTGGRSEPASTWRTTVPGALAVAGLASAAAGAIHATAAGAHGEVRQAAIAFTVLAVLQLAWGAVALTRSHRLIVLAGVAINAVAVGGWVLAKTSGISFIEGLEDSESAQFADSAAAGLAAVAVVGGLLALVGRLTWARRPRPGLAGVAAVAAVGLAGPAMVLTGGHSHAAGGHGHDEMAGMDHGHEAASVMPPERFDGTLPVDFSGVPGVSAEEQASAEELATITIEKLPQFAADGPNQADEQALNELGFYSIGDGGTGTEHFVNWAAIEDEHILNPDYPESLVFDVTGPNEKTLAAAMFMLKTGDRLGDQPDVGGELIQWHEHQDLCYAGTPGQWRVADVAMPPEECREGTSRLGDPVPMMHVWIRAHPCGPFAALEGVGGGQIAEGEEVACDHVHGGSDPASIADDADEVIAAEGADGPGTRADATAGANGGDS